MSDIKLPPLPKPFDMQYDDIDRTIVNCYSTQQVEIYARQCVLADRAARADAWQPIVTAPKDGRTLLLGYYNRAGKWRTVRGQWMSEAYIAESWEDPDDAEPGWFETSVEADDPPNCWAIDPTKWMPLPAAPTQERGADDAPPEATK